MKRLSALFALVCVFFLAANPAVAQIGSGVIALSPKDTLICPDQTITLNGSFTSYIDNIGTDDDFSDQIIPIGFPFVFFGQTFTKCVVSGNNFLSFDTLNVGNPSSYVYNSAKANNQLTNAIMFPFQDLNSFFGGTISAQTFGQAPNRKFVVEFCKVPFFSCTNLLATDQVVLHEGTNIVEIHIGEKPVCTGWQGGTGIEGLRGNGFESLVPGRDLPNVPWVTANDSRRFTPTSASTYTIDSIPYGARILIPGADENDIEWFEEGNPLSIGTGASITVTPTQNINYYIAQISGQNGCLGTMTYTFQDTVFIHYGTSYDTTQLEICAGETYNWFGRTLFQAGNYDTLLKTVLGCDSFLRLQLFVNPLPNIAMKNFSATVGLCGSDSTVLSLLNPEATTTYQWYKDGNPITVNGQSPKYTVKEAGVYTLTATTDKGCTLTTPKVTVTINPTPDALIEPLDDKVLCTYDTLTLKAKAGADYDYRWAPEKAFRFVTGPDGQTVRGVFLKPTEVVLTVYNQFGCYDSDTINVVTKPCCEVFTPNAFSPNGDGLNDYFRPHLQPGQILLELKIFDRYGKLVYNNENLKKGWDGRYGTEEAKGDVYMYYVKYSCDDGKTYDKKESVTLIR